MRLDPIALGGEVLAPEPVEPAMIGGREQRGDDYRRRARVLAAQIST